MLETHNQAEPMSRVQGRKGAYGRACGRRFVKNRWYPGRKCKVGIDGNGNLLKKGDTTYTWDARDRLVSTRSGGSYGYDTSNLRTKMGEQKVLLDGIEEAREYGTSEVRYDHDPSRVDGLLAQKAGGVKGYFVTDALGSVYAVVDASGAVVSKYGYDVYGARTATTEGMATGWGFTGRRHDGAGEMYYRARYLDGGMGRFAQPDPIRTFGLTSGDGPFLRTLGLAEQQLVHAYAYAMASPVTRTDALGLFSPGIHSELTEGILLSWHWDPFYAQVARICNVDQDRLSNQLSNYQHGMSDRGEKRLDAYRRWRRFTDEQLALAGDRLCRGDKVGSACELGRGLHAVQDRWAHHFISLPTHLNPAYLISDFAPSYDDLIFADLESWEYVERFMASDVLSSRAMGQAGGR